jgi:group II intron reverse transcriptase/maturase
MRMQKSHEVLQAIRKLGVKRIPLTRVYRCLLNEQLFLTAYSKIYCNQGALTPGTEDDTMDGMSVGRIRNLIELLRHEQFYPRPNRRTRAPKKSGGTRPLGIPNGSEKLVQEVLRMVLEAYYEPRFRESSHGFRPERGCHTALKEVKNRFQNTTWFIEGDIKGCFDNIDHNVLLDILQRDIQDGRILQLIERFLKAGYMEDWQYHKTYSGTPQGDILSPLLSNIYLNELDNYIEGILIPQYSRGKRRATNPKYKSLSQRIERARRNGDMEKVHTLEQERRLHPAIDTEDTDFRRLRYVRYADDFILGFIGPKTEALDIKTHIGTFLKDTLHLQMSQQKTLITHAKTQHARFLGYAVSIYHADDKIARREYDTAKVRSINGKVRLGIPYGLIDERIKAYQQNGKVVSVPQMLQSSVPHILLTFQHRFRGLVQYYQYAVDVSNFGKLKYAMEIALVKTLAHKLRIKVSRVYRRYRTTKEVNGQSYRVLQVKVDTGNKVTSFWWGAIPLKVKSIVHQPINDNREDYDNLQYAENRSELVTRLCANQCEVCGAETECEAHHVRKLADLKIRWQGRREKPLWVQKMIALQRKTLIVCPNCHRKIHNGEPLPQKPSV